MNVENQKILIPETSQLPTEEQLELPLESTQLPTENQLESNQNQDLQSEFSDLSDNIIHQLFFELGVNLDYVPKSDYECFTMGCQLICGLFFIWWFVKMLVMLMRQMYKG